LILSEKDKSFSKWQKYKRRRNSKQRFEAAFKRHLKHLLPNRSRDAVKL